MLIIKKINMKNVYFNTTKLSSKKLIEAIKSANSQQEKVLLFLDRNKNKSFTRSEISYILKKEFGVKIGRHEVGRCLSDLHDKGLGFVDKLGLRVSACGVGKAEHEYKSVFPF